MFKHKNTLNLKVISTRYFRWKALVKGNKGIKVGWENDVNSGQFLSTFIHCHPQSKCLLDDSKYFHWFSSLFIHKSFDMDILSYMTM